MGKGRIEAFSDGVIAIIITIMVLELKVPHGDDFAGAAAAAAGVAQLRAELRLRRHLLEQPPPHAARHATTSAARVLWANLHLLFWLSLIPFVTGWMGENHFAAAPTALYGVVLLMAALAYTILQTMIVAAEGDDSVLRAAVGRDMKGKLSLAGYLLAIAMAFVSQWLSGLLYVSVALMWLVPDRRIERTLGDHR